MNPPTPLFTLVVHTDVTHESELGGPVDVGPQVARGALSESARSFDARKTRTQDDKDGSVLAADDTRVLAVLALLSPRTLFFDHSVSVILSVSLTSTEGSRTFRGPAACR